MGFQPALVRLDSILSVVDERLDNKFNNDENWNNRSGPGMNAYQLTGFLNNDLRGGVGYRKNLVSGLDPIVIDVIFEPICYFLGQESNLRFLPTFWVADGNLSFLNIPGLELEDLTDTHAAACHKFEHQAVSWTSRPEDDLIDDILFQDLERGWFAGFE